MKITMEGKYTTRDGRPVRILCVDGPGAFPVVGLVPGSALPDCWQCDGSWSGGHDEESRDLIPAKPEPVVEWVILDAEGRVVEFTAEKRCIRDVNIWNSSPGGNKPYCLVKRTTEIIEP